MAELTYQQRKTGRTQTVGDWETVKRSILERSGWFLVEDEGTGQPESQSEAVQVEQPEEGDFLEDGQIPADATVDDVLVAVEDGRVTAAEALRAEQAGKNRITLAEQLEALL